MRRLEELSEAELRNEICGLGIEGLDRAKTTDDLLLGYMRQLADVFERSGESGVKDYLASAREGFAP